MITYHGHASFELDYNGFNMLLDPWLFKGAFLNSWVHFPPLQLSDFQIKKMAENCDAIWVSHEHPDHMDEKFIDLLPRDIMVILPKFPGTALIDKFKEMNFTNIVKIDHRQSLIINKDITVEILMEMPKYSVHSSLFVQTKDYTFFHNSDSTIAKDDLIYLNDKYGGCDIYAGQYSVSSPFPDISLEMEEDERHSFISNHLDWAINRFSSSFIDIGARQGIACAGPAININLEKSVLLERMRDEQENGSNHGYNFIKSISMLREKTNNKNIFIPKVGGSIDFISISNNIKHCNAEFLTANKTSIVNEIAFETSDSILSADVDQLWLNNRRFFNRLFEDFGFILLDLDFQFLIKFTDLDLCFVVNFPSRKVEKFIGNYKAKNECFFEFHIHSFHWFNFISNRVCYDEIHYSKRFSTHHSPDGYKGALFNAFRASHDRALIKDMREDILSNDNETFDIEVNGLSKSYRVRCPHLGIRLDPSNVNENGELVCPGHGWRFALDDGRCTFGDLSCTLANN
ncbi:MBL fold metallo-hydrolase [Alphaproteobacteria bacterium]|nr:MBL fold metallo-hydrolase [Alphaproteobacteria bacterium]